MAGLTARVMAVSISGEKFTREHADALKDWMGGDRLCARRAQGAEHMRAWGRVCVAGVAISFLLGSYKVIGANHFDQKAASAVDEVFDDLAKPGSPGCALGVYRDGQMIYAKGYGF